MKIIIAVNYLYKTLHRRCLTEFWISLGIWICQGSEFLNIPGFWIYQSWEHTRVLNMLLVLSMSGYWIYHGFKYTRFTQGSEYAWIWLSNSWICYIMPEYAGICMNMHKSVWMGFFTIMDSNPLSKGTIDCFLEE